MKETSLIKVKTIKKSHALQIEFASRDRAKIIFQMLRDSAIEPLGWVPGASALDNRMGDYWLVQHTNQLFWLAAPARESDLWKKHKPEQIFI